MSLAPLHALRARMNHVMLGDYHRLRRRWKGLLRAAEADQDISKGLAQFTEAVEASCALAASRRAQIPTPTYPEELPIAQRRGEIREALANNPVVIVCGETGSGKTTQLPKICLELGRGVRGTIAHTQPRRIAARSVAARIAEELETTVGAGVGYKVRFDNQVAPTSYIKLMTDGMLLAETQGDPWLSAYDTIIIDEAHERSLNIDFLLGYIKELISRRDDLLVIVTSATIDPERFSRHFDDAPIIEVSGRTFPVDIRYRPPPSETDEDIDWPRAIESALQELFDEGPGDALVFLPGERQIREAADHLRKHMQDVELVPLFARLSAKDQRRVFLPHAGRRVVLATNVAETSLTVPGIRYVVDPGLARINRYSNRRKVQRLPIEPISQASASQRSGRCGRTADGIAIRLYSEREFDKRDAFTTPEILRSNLAAVILQMKALGLGDVEAFPFLEPPRAGMIRDGYLTLFEIGAVEDDGSLTDRGYQLSRLPVDPRLGRILTEADTRGCLAEALIITSALSVQEPRERPPDAREDADRAHLRFRHPDSDFLGILKLWGQYHKQKADLGSSRLKRWCKDNHLSSARMREWIDVWRQLRELAKTAGMIPSENAAPTTAVHRAVLAGLLINIGNRTEKYAYQGAHASKFWLWPGSALHAPRPRWIVAAERVETTRLYGRNVAPIDPAWIEPLAKHLVVRSHYDPHWNRRLGHVCAFERVLLFEIEIISKRKVEYTSIHPRQSREIFIRHALVHGRWKTRERFFRHNHELVQDLSRHEARARRTGLLADAEDRFAFYHERIPADVCSGPSLEQWLKRERASAPRALFMEEHDLLLDPSLIPSEADYPVSIENAGLRLPVTYRFEPGHEADGPSIQIPLAALAQLDTDRMGWLVPGLVREKIIHLLRALPKARRRLLVPLPETADQMLEHMPFGEGSLFAAMSTALERLRHARIPLTAWRTEELPPYLAVHITVVDEDGKRLASGRSLSALRGELHAPLQATVSGGLAPKQERTGLTTWDVEPLAKQVALEQGRYTVHGFPALLDEGESVALRILDSAARAATTHRLGVIRLLALALAKPLRQSVRGLPEIQRMRLWYGSLPVRRTLDQVIADRIVERAVGDDVGLIRDAAAFEQAVGRARQGLARAATEIGALAHDILARYHDVASKLMLEPPAPYKASVDDMIGHLAVLLSGEFLLNTPFTWLTEFPRYLDALDKRLVRLGQGGLAKDQAHVQTLARHEVRLTKRGERLAKEGVGDPALVTYRWMIEELRVVLWAQELGTKIPISAKRLQAQWDRVRA